MRVVHFDDGDFDWAMPNWDIEKPVADMRASLDDWFSSLASVWSANTALTSESGGLFLIHANGQFSGLASRQDLEGIELLKHIRLTNLPGEMRTWHAIVYSFEPLDTILHRKPGDLILTTHGVTFLRLPGCLNLEGAIRIAYAVRRECPTFQQLSQDPSYRASLDRTFRSAVSCDYAAPDSGHAISNWWGARQLIVGVRRLDGATEVGRLPKSIEAALSKLDNKKAMFLAQHDSEAQPRDEDKDAQVKGAMDLLRKRFEAFLVRPKVVYVDDEIDQGWDEAVHLLITGRSLPVGEVSWFHTTIGKLAQIDNSLEDWQEIADLVLEQKPDLILSDLRLQGTHEAGIEVRETSGAKLVGLLRERAPGVPILLLTASNKAWTFQEAFQLGVDAYWMKEGIGDHASPGRSIENTSELMRLLGKLLGPDYQLLSKIQLHIDGFVKACSDGNAPWWMTMKWPAPDPPLKPKALVPPRVTTPNVAAVIGLLRSAARSYREYLRLFELQYGSRDLNGGQSNESNFWLQSLAVHVGRIVEAIHGFDDIRSNVDKPGKKSVATRGTIGGYTDENGCAQKMRRDWFGQALYDVRNIAAHYDPQDPVITNDNIRSLLEALIAWLSTPPERLSDPHSLRLASDGNYYYIWPKATDLFRGADMDPKLVSEYVKLHGSPKLNLPRRRT